MEFEAVNKGRRPLSDLTLAQRKAAAKYFRQVAKSTRGKYAKPAAQFQKLRSDFLLGKTKEVPGTLVDFMKRRGL